VEHDLRKYVMMNNKNMLALLLSEKFYFSEFIYCYFIYLLINELTTLIFRYIYSFKKEKVPEIIILTGAIGVGKTTYAENLKRNLTNEGKKVYLPMEMSLRMKKEFDFFIRDPEAFSFFFQYAILNEYDKMIKELKMDKSYDYIILDRTHLDTSVFTKLTVGGNDLIEYLEDIKKKIRFPFPVKKVIYLKPRCDVMVSRCVMRDRESDRGHEDYLVEVYDKYEEMMPDLYLGYNIEEIDNSD
jgi:deoxyadenosine/deoxycytidine kinase